VLDPSFVIYDFNRSIIFIGDIAQLYYRYTGNDTVNGTQNSFNAFFNNSLNIRIYDLEYDSVNGILYFVDTSISYNTIYKLDITTGVVYSIYSWTPISLTFGSNYYQYDIVVDVPNLGPYIYYTNDVQGATNIFRLDPITGMAVSILASNTVSSSCLVYNNNYIYYSDLIKGGVLRISANAAVNTGIDTIFIECPQSTYFGLSFMKFTIYNNNIYYASYCTSITTNLYGSIKVYSDITKVNSTGTTTYLFPTSDYYYVSNVNSLVVSDTATPVSSIPNYFLLNVPNVPIDFTYDPKPRTSSTSPNTGFPTNYVTTFIPTNFIPTIFNGAWKIISGFMVILVIMLI